MLFNSIHFLVFFPTVTILYFLLPYRRRWILLLIASCYFYMALIPIYILVLFFLIAIDYTAGILIENSLGARRRLFLIVSLCANIGMLGHQTDYVIIISPLYDEVALNHLDLA